MGCRSEVEPTVFAEERDQLESTLGVHDFSEGGVDGRPQRVRAEDSGCLLQDIVIDLHGRLRHALMISALTDGSARSRCQSDTLASMAMTLRLTDDEQTALRERAESEGISLQEAARRAVRDYVARGQHRDRVSAAAGRVMKAHREALDRLGQ